MEVVAVSSLRETAPWGLVEQPAFVNGALELETDLEPHDLLEALLELERRLGRRRDAPTAEQWGPRVIDLDLLLYGDLVVDRPGLRVPHPHLHERRFALEPLAELAPERGRHPTVAPSRSCSPRWKRREIRAVADRLARMSHLDKLDEFEAELELQLKREYTAVFSLFRYCVLTQDATYLCNKLDLKVVPQASYPFFHAQMEDVWVWDKNRPTRMIPRAEIYTSGDVTVEELRGEDDEPRLTAEALAARSDDARRPDDEEY